MLFRSLGALLASAGVAAAEGPAALPPAAPLALDSLSVLSPEACAPTPSATLCAGVEPCGPYGRAWVSAEWLYWVGSGQGLPPLITTGPIGAPRTVAGVLGNPGTAVLFGGDRVNNDWRNGLRVQAGLWLDEEQTFGLHGDFFFLEGSNQGRTAGFSGPFVPGALGAAGSPSVNRPFTDAVTGLPTTQFVSLPGVVSGTVDARASSDFIGGGLGLLCNLCCDCRSRWDFTLGYRYLNLNDEVSVRENLTALPGSGVLPGTRIAVSDRFRTNNDFHGVPIGIRGERRAGRFYGQLNASVALGVTNSTTTIDGSTVFTPPGGAPAPFAGGLLAQPTNIGRYERDDFAVVPEVGFRLGYQVAPSLRVFAGYTFLYWSTVTRAGDQIDLAVNQALLAPPRPLDGTPARPLFQDRQTDFWVQGVSVGAELRY